MIIFKKAEDSDYKDCFALVEKRIRWMNDNDISHWNKTGYLEKYPLSHYRNLQSDGELYVLEDEKEIVAFGALLDEDERWPDRKCAFYLHHLTSKVSDKRYGKKFIIAAVKFAILRDKKFFRLDSSADYPKLEEYYNQFGFKEAGKCADGLYHGILRQIDLDDKKTLRKFSKTINPDSEYIDEASLIIENKVLESAEYKNADSIFIYLSADKEVKTDIIIEKAFKDGKKIYVPRCDGDNMNIVEIKRDSIFVTNQYGIREPLGEASGEMVDLAIVPCLAAGKDLSRLGHGKGYYDRYLKDHPVYKMILCFDELVFEKVPMTDDDIFMDKLVSENI